MSLYETLKAAKLGAAPDVFTKLRAQIAPFAKDGSTPTEKELEDSPPLSFNANGEPLIDWTIYGATMETGDRTSNLFDKNATDTNNGYVGNGYLITDGTTQTNSSYRISEYIPILSNQKYITYAAGLNNPSVCFYDTDKNYISGVNYAGRQNAIFTTSSDAKYLRLSFRAADADIMFLNIGDTVLPYEPYGFVLPVQCGGVTTNIYLAAPLGASDSISMTDTGISIPTVDGSNTLSVGTTIQPSSVYIKYKE